MIAAKVVVKKNTSSPQGKWLWLIFCKSSCNNRITNLSAGSTKDTQWLCVTNVCRIYTRYAAAMCRKCLQDLQKYAVAMCHKCLQDLQKLWSSDCVTNWTASSTEAMKWLCDKLVCKFYRSCEVTVWQTGLHDLQSWGVSRWCRQNCFLWW